MSSPHPPNAPRTFAAWLKQTPSPTSPPLPPTTSTLPVLVIGAGPAGLSAMRALLASSIPCTGVDSASSVGGLWSPLNRSSPAYPSLVTNSSRFTTTLYPHPSHPSSPPHLSTHLTRDEACAYLTAYAHSHHLLPHIRFHTTVTHLRKDPLRGTWWATLRTQAQGTDDEGQGEGEGVEVEEEYRGVVVAVGPQSKSSANPPPLITAMADAARIPHSHASSFTGPTPYLSLRTLVIGFGNSGAEIATAIAPHTRTTLIACRTSPWIVPLRIAGVPADLVASLSHPFPHAVQMATFHLCQRLAVGHPTALGLPCPAHDILDRLPVLDRGIVKEMRAGRVRVRGVPIEMRGREEGEGKVKGGGWVRFDGAAEEEEVDAIIFATGYRRHLPFLDKQYGELDDPTFRLTLGILHPAEPGLMFMPEIVVPQGVWPMYTAQAKALAAYLKADARRSARLEVLNGLRGSVQPDWRGNIFRAAPDVYHADPVVFTKLMADFTAWISAV